MVFEVILVLILVFLNGFFVAAEFSLVSVRQSQIELKIQAGNAAAKMVDHIHKNLNTYLSATQTGITLCSLALGWFGEEVANEIIESLFVKVGISVESNITHTISGSISFFCITAMHIILGEQIPKNLAIQKSEKISLATALPLRIFFNIFRPIIWLLNLLSTAALKTLGLSAVSHKEEHSTEELRMLLERGKETGAIETAEHELIENVFHFNETNAKQVMIPRTKLVALEASTSDEKIMEVIHGEGFSRLPVYKNTIDDIVGIVSTKDILKMVSKGETIVLSNHLRPAYFIPETKKINELMKDFQRKRLHMAVVIDEFGGTAGIVTMEDVIEELVGEIRDEDDDEEKSLIEKISDTEFLVSGQMPISEINENLRYPLPEGDDFETVGGLMSFIFGKIPELNEEKEFGGYHFKIIKTANKVVEQVKISELLSADD
jgi:CBS domain containing-hemolysin-like protein